MRRKVAVLGAISVALSAAAPATAADVGHACLGSKVALTAQFIQQNFGMGFGAYFKTWGEIPGQVIQENRLLTCTTDRGGG